MFRAETSTHFGLRLCGQGKRFPLKGLFHRNLFTDPDQVPTDLSTKSASDRIDAFDPLGSVNIPFPVFEGSNFTDPMEREDPATETA